MSPFESILNPNAEPFFPENYNKEKKALPMEQYAKLASDLLDLWKSQKTQPAGYQEKSPGHRKTSSGKMVSTSSSEEYLPENYGFNQNGNGKFCVIC